MQKFLLLLVLTLFTSCTPEMVEKIYKQGSWETRQISEGVYTNFVHGQSYLPLYSHIYYQQSNKAFYLTSTVSIRNISSKDPFYLLKADYYDTNGVLVKGYLKNPIYINPLETIEIVIAESDTTGGSGANFIFDWAIKNEKNLPLFEAVMISTSGQQGLSFSTRAVQVF